VPPELEEGFSVDFPNRRTAIADEQAGSAFLEGEQSEAVALVAHALVVDPRPRGGAIERLRVVAHRHRIAEHLQQRLDVGAVVVERTQH